jgi:hypothetical protein
MPLVSVPDIADVDVYRGERVDARAVTHRAIDLLIEIPHGATRTEDFTRLAARLTSALPDGLIDFFYANTDAGAPELGEAIAKRFVEMDEDRTVAIVRCRIPRTLIDCNRRIDATPEDFKAGKVTPGLMPWIVTDDDRVLLRGLYDRYCGAVTEAERRLAPDGAMLLLHSCAPRSVDVEVDLEIVERIHAAYRPEVEPTWPLRPQLDVIGKALDGTQHAPAAIVGALHRELAAIDLVAGDSTTYPLHPSTLAWDRVMAHPGRALCLEVRRDLLADPFEPFAEMRIAPAKVARLAGPLAAALRRWW